MNFILVIQTLVVVQSSECYDAVVKVMNNAGSTLFGNQSYTDELELTRLSGKSVNELGHYEACLRRDDTSYYLLEANVGIKLITGICVPKQCSVQEIDTLVTHLSSGRVHANTVYDSSVTGFGWFLMTMLITFTCLGILGSIYDFSKRRSLMFAVIHSFSFKRNFDGLVSVRQSKPGDHSNILDSMRVFAIFMVICTHAFSFKSQNPIYNVEEIEFFFKRSWRNFPSLGEVAVDGFFWIGGFLMGYLLLQEVEKKRGKFGFLGWTLVYLHRFARVLPVYIFMLAFYMNIFPALGNGPAWHNSKIIIKDCSQYWWSVPLFLNNFIPGGYGNQCLGVGWYLANDMQFFALAPALILMYYSLARWVSWAIKFILVVIGFIVCFVIAYEHEYQVYMPSRKNSEGGNEDYYHMFYTKPYIRFFPYLIGLYSGYVYLRYYKKYVEKVEDTHKDWISEKVIDACRNKTYGTVIFITAFTVCVWMVLILDPLAEHYLDTNYWGRTKNAFWLPLRRILFTYGFTFFLLPIMIGRFPFIYQFLSANFFSPLGKLCFTCFLVQFGVLFWLFANERSAAMVHGTIYLKDTIVGTVLSFAVSLPVYLIIESPFANLEKIICSMLAKPKGQGKQ